MEFNDYNRPDVKLEDVTAELRNVLPIPIPITERMLRIGQMIGPIVQELTHDRYEVGGFYITDISKDFALKDFIIPKKLPIAPDNIQIEEHYPATDVELVAQNKEKSREYRMAALFHVHPGSYKAEHSGQDDGQLSKLVNKAQKTNRRIIVQPLELIASKVKVESGKETYVMRGDEASDAVLKYTFPNDEAFYAILKEYGLNPDPKTFDKGAFMAKVMERLSLETSIARIVNFGISFVFNNKGDMPYVVMAVRDKTILTGAYNYFTISNVPLQIIEKGVNLPTKEELEAIVKDRVALPRPRFFQRRVEEPLIVKVGDNQTIVIPISRLETPVAPPAKQDIPVVKKADVTAAKVAQSTAQVTPAPTVATKPIEQKKPGVVKKDYEQFTQTELACSFMGAVLAYTASYKSNDCEYGQYLYGVIDKLGIAYMPGTLEETVAQIGKLKKDVDQEKSTVPDVQGLLFLSKRIIDELIKSDSQEAKDFMRKFTVATNKERNRLLESFVNGVFGETAKATDGIIDLPLFEEGPKNAK